MSTDREFQVIAEQFRALGAADPEAWARSQVEEVDDERQPLEEIDLLHKNVLDTDPSGREMRPRGVGREG